MACYKKRQTKKSGIVWDVVFRIKIGDKEVQKKLSGFPTKEAAQNAYKDYVETESQKPVYQIETQSKSSTSLVNAFNAYLESQQGILSPSSIYRKLLIYRVHIMPYFAGRQIDGITRYDIMQWQETVWNTKTKKGELLTQEGCVQINKTFRVFMRWAYDAYSLSSNPFDGLKLPHRREQKKELTVWTPEMFEIFIKGISNIKYKMYFTLLYLTGCRRNEINALDVDDFVKENGRYFVKISKTATYIVGKGEEVYPPKTQSSNRTISLPSGLTPELDDFLEGKSGYLWMVSDSAIERQFNRRLNKTDLPHIRIHDLRHSHASLLVSSGIPVTTVSKRLGHKSVSTTLKKYTHYIESNENDVLNALNKLNEK